MKENKTKQKEQIDKILSTIEKQQYQIEKLTILVESAISNENQVRKYDMEKEEGASDGNENATKFVEPLKVLDKSNYIESIIFRIKEYFIQIQSTIQIKIFMSLLIGATFFSIIGNQILGNIFMDMSLFVFTVGIVTMIMESVIKLRKESKNINLKKPNVLISKTDNTR